MKSANQRNGKTEYQVERNREAITETNNGQDKHHQYRNQESIGQHQDLFGRLLQLVAQPCTGQQTGQKNGDNDSDLQINITEKDLECKDNQNFTSHGQAARGK